MIQKVTLLLLHLTLVYEGAGAPKCARILTSHQRTPSCCLGFSQRGWVFVVLEGVNTSSRYNYDYVENIIFTSSKNTIEKCWKGLCSIKILTITEWIIIWCALQKPATGTTKTSIGTLANNAPISQNTIESRCTHNYVRSEYQLHLKILSRKMWQTSNMNQHDEKAVQENIV